MAVRRIPIINQASVPDNSGDVYPIGFDFWALNDRWDKLVTGFRGTEGKNLLRGGFAVPTDYRSDPAIKIVWTSSVISGTVVWDFEYRAVGGNDTESFDQLGTQEARTVTDTAPTVAYRRLESTIPLTEANFSPDDEVNFIVARDGPAESTGFMNGIALVSDIFFQYNTVHPGVIADPVDDEPEPPAPGGFIVGLNINQFESGSFDAVGQGFTQELGVHSVRVGFNHGNHDFGVNWAADRGKGVLFFTGYSAGGNPNQNNAAGATSRQAHADRAAGLVQTYGNKVQFWEVWNEWNIGLGLGGPGTGNDGDPALYADLLRRTYLAIKNVDQDAQVVGCCFSGMGQESLPIILDEGGGDHMDYLSVHPYVFRGAGQFVVGANGTAAAAVAKHKEAIASERALIFNAIGRHIPIISTEDGIGTLGQASREATQASYITGIYTAGRNGEIPGYEGIWFYSLEDTPGGSGFGVVRNNNTKKPGFFSLQAEAQT